MCRLLGVVSRTPSILAAQLVPELPTFQALSLEHGHGWGVGWIDDRGCVDVRKDTTQASLSAGVASPPSASPGAPG